MTQVANSRVKVARIAGVVCLIAAVGVMLDGAGSTAVHTAISVVLALCAAATFLFGGRLLNGQKR